MISLTLETSTYSRLIIDLTLNTPGIIFNQFGNYATIAEVPLTIRLFVLTGFVCLHTLGELIRNGKLDPDNVFKNV